MFSKIQHSAIARGWLIPLFLGIAFLAITIPGIEWGIPNGWNPDELVQEVVNALHGRAVFDEEDFTYPSLPKHTMYAVGRIAMALGYGDSEVIWASRLMSVLLGALVVIGTYTLARQIGVDVRFSLFAALIVFTSSLLAQNARFAHNDIYLTFFTIATTWASLRFTQTSSRGWFYFACFLAGLAASSKYNGIGLLLLPLSLFFLGKEIGKSGTYGLRTAETLALGLLLTGLGYASGTPKSLFWMTFYFKRMIPELIEHSVYGFRPDSTRGIIGQWGTIGAAFGHRLGVTAIVAFGYALFRMVRKLKDGVAGGLPQLVVPLAIVAIDLPILFSFNYPARFFLPLVPLLAVLIGQLAQDLFAWLRRKGGRAVQQLFLLAVVWILSFSFLTVIGVMLLFKNDARGPAGEFLSGLPVGSSAEYTFYPPIINREIFTRAYTYPLFFIKYPGETPPTDHRFEYNTGAAGVADRQPDYLIVDSFTYERFRDPFICDSIPAECEFFTDLLAGNTEYVLIGNFEYDLPAWIPNMPRSFLNPDIRVYQKANP